MIHQPKGITECELLFRRNSKTPVFWAESALLLVALVWGLTFPLVRFSLTELSPFSLLFLCSGSALLVLSILHLLKKQFCTTLQAAWKPGIILGSLCFGGYVTQTIGLQTTLSAHSAFLTNLSLFFVYLLSPFFMLGLPNRRDLISLGLAVVGMSIILNPLRAGGGFLTGDLWVLSCAVFFSLYIQTLSFFSKKYPNTTSLIFNQFLTFFALSALSMWMFQPQDRFIFPRTSEVWWAVISLGPLAFIFTMSLQTRFQHHTTPERATILLYTTDPIFAGIFGYIFLREILSLQTIVGGIFIIAAAVWFIPYRRLRHLKTGKVQAPKTDLFIQSLKQYQRNLTDGRPIFQSNIAQQKTLVEQFLTVYSESGKDFFDRHFISPGHSTSSALVLNHATTHILLTHHAKLNLWLPLGGHADGEYLPWQVALKEAQEESGIQNLHFIDLEHFPELCTPQQIPWIFDIDIHTIPENSKEPAHQHFDIQYLLIVIGKEKFQVSGESFDLRWVPLEEVPLISQDETLLRQVGKLRALLSSKLPLSPIRRCCNHGVLQKEG